MHVDIWPHGRPTRAGHPRLSATRALATLALLASLAGLSPSQASAATTRSVPTQYATIQQAVNASQPGDTIKILAGTYTFPAIDTFQTITVGVDNLTITGDCAKPLAVVVNGAGPEPDYFNQTVSFTIKGDNDTLECLQVVNGGDNVDVHGSGFKGINLHVSGAFTDDEFFPGWNFYVTGSRFTLTDSEVSDSWDEDIMFDVGAHNAVLQNVDIHDAGYSCVVTYAPNVKILSSQLSSCWEGSGVEQYAANLDIENSIIKGVSIGCVSTWYDDYGSLTMTNVNCSSAGYFDDTDAIQAGSNSLIQGGSISSPAGPAVSIYGSSATVTGVKISQAGFDSYAGPCIVDAGHGNTITNNSIDACLDDGIWAIAASNDVISGNIVKNIASGGGIDAAGNNITITKNTITNPHTFGISYHCPASCANGTIANNTVSGAGGTGIAAEITGSGVFKVTGNTVSSSIADGALLVLNNGLISGNTLLKNGPGYAGFAGMHVQGNHNTITSNTFKNNGDDGLQAQGNSNSIVGNTATLNALDGIEVEASSSGNVLQGNAVTQNMGVGIEILAGAPSPDVLRKNTASGNLARACATADPGYVTLGTGTNANSFTSCGAGVGPETAVTHNVPAAPAQASAQPSRPVRPARPRRPLQSPRGS